MLFKNFNSFLRRQSPICKGAFLQNGRKPMTTVTKSGDGQLAAVDLAYASYETISSREDKSPIVILHGFLGSKNNWNSLSKVIHKNTERKVITLDARNHGDSPHTAEHTYKLMTADLVQLLNKLGIQKVNLMGHSMGGRTAMLMALLHPGFVSSLTIVDIAPMRTSPNIYSLSNILEAMSRVQIEPGVPMALARRMADRQLFSIVDQDTKNFIITNLVQTSAKTYHWRVNIKVLKAALLTEMSALPRLAFGYKYSGPTLILAGENSDYVRKIDHKHIRKLFPKAKVKYVEGAGHLLHSQKPEEFLRNVVAFLDKK